MNDRGMYGQRSLPAYGMYGYGISSWQVRAPMVGMDRDDKRRAIDAGVDLVQLLFTTVTGAYFGGKVTPEDPTKGKIVGAGVGYLAALLLRQNVALTRIAENTRPRDAV